MHVPIPANKFRMEAKMKNVKINSTWSEKRTKKGAQSLLWEENRSKEYWDYRKDWYDYPKKQFVSEGPIHLDLETTSICNLLCPYCPRTEPAKKGEFAEGSMSFEFFSSLIDQGSEFNARSVKFNFLGEPLMHPDLTKQIKYAKKKGFVEVMINTNATLLTEKKSKEILDAGLDSIFFSFDSPYPERFKKMRVGADFYEVKRNIDNFMKIKNKGNYKHVQTRVNLTLLNQSKKEIDDYEKMFLDKIGIIGVGEYVDPNKDYSKEGIVDDFVCSQPFQRMFINFDGVVRPCCLDRYASMKMGNAHESTLVDIWNSKRYKKLRDAMINGTYYKIQMCKKCYAPHCNYYEN